MDAPDRFYDALVRSWSGTAVQECFQLHARFAPASDAARAQPIEAIDQKLLALRIEVRPKARVVVAHRIDVEKRHRA
jgi:hypothetical protein